MYLLQQLKKQERHTEPMVHGDVVENYFSIGPEKYRDQTPFKENIQSKVCLRLNQ